MVNGYFVSMESRKLIAENVTGVPFVYTEYRRVVVDRVEGMVYANMELKSPSVRFVVAIGFVRTETVSTYVRNVADDLYAHTVNRYKRVDCVMEESTITSVNMGVRRVKKNWTGDYSASFTIWIGCWI